MLRQYFWDRSKWKRRFLLLLDDFYLVSCKNIYIFANFYLVVYYYLKSHLKNRVSADKEFIWQNNKSAMKAIVITRVFIILTQSLLYAQPYKECHPDKKICEYWLVVKEKLTMIYNKDLVYAADGKLYKYDEHPSNYTTEVGHLVFLDFPLL